MTNQPKISIIVPAYNCAATIQKTLQSIQAQTWQRWEAFVVDDCSTDTTKAAVIEFAQRDYRIQLLENNFNQGPARARNQGIASSSGEFIAFLDADDIWEPEKLERQMAVLLKTGSDLCYTSYSFIDEMDRLVHKPYIIRDQVDYHGLLRENVIGCSTVLLRKAALKDHRFNSVFSHEDFALWLCLLREGALACGVPEVLVCYRLGGRSDNKWKAAKGRWDIYRRCEGLPIYLSICYMVHYAGAAIRKYRG